MISLINIKENPQQMPNTFAFSKYIFGEKIQFRCRDYHVHLVFLNISLEKKFIFGAVTIMSIWFFLRLQFNGP